MTDPYFAKLPTITYQDRFVKDITRRIDVSQMRELPVDLYPYTIRDFLRADQVAELYYEDPFVDWLIYLVNDVVDPYGQWYMTDDELAEILKKKYGSVEKAKKKVVYYENNWWSTDQSISVSHYESVIPESWKKYYSPNFGLRGEILSYARKRSDTRVNTNRTIDHAISYSEGNSFTIGEIVGFKTSGQDSTVGVGEVVFSNSSVLRVQSVSGDVYANSSATKDVVGEDSGTNATSTFSNVVHENFTTDEGSFWSAVYAYDVEVEKNEKRKNIRLIDKDVYQLALNRIEDLLGPANSTVESG